MPEGPEVKLEADKISDAIASVPVESIFFAFAGIIFVLLIYINPIFGSVPHCSLSLIYFPVEKSITRLVNSEFLRKEFGWFPQFFRSSSKVVSTGV